MIVKDAIPAHIVEKVGFKDLIMLLEPKYVMVSQQCIQRTLIPEKVRNLLISIKQQLADIQSCSVTIDIWSSRRMHSYFGITCHFINNDWNMKQFLLCCKQLKGRHSGDNNS